MRHFKKSPWILAILFSTSNGLAGTFNGSWQLISPSLKGLINVTMSIQDTDAFLNYAYSSSTTDEDTVSFSEQWVIDYDKSDDIVYTDASITMVSLTSVHRLYQKLKISDEISRVRFSLSADRQSISMHHLDGDFKGKEEHYQRVE